MTDDERFATLRNEILELKERLGTWQSVGDHYGVSRTIVWRIANQNYEPKNNPTRRKLGLLELILFRAGRDPLGRYQKRHD